MDLWHDALEIKTKTNLKQNVIFFFFYFSPDKYGEVDLQLWRLVSKTIRFRLICHYPNTRLSL